MDVSPKFIIEDGNLILMKVSYHKNIVTDINKVSGGGWFNFKKDLNMFIFYGDSHEFGKAKFVDVKRCVEEGRVYSDKYLSHNITNKHKFGYDTGSEIINLN